MSLNNHPLHPMIARAKSEPFFLGHTLAQYAATKSLNDDALAADLGCDLDRLPHLMLCRNIDMGEIDYEQGIRGIALYVPCDAVALRDAIESVY